MGKFDARESVLQIKEKKKMLETPQYDIVQMKKKGKWRLKIYFSSLWELRGKKVKKS